MTVGIVGRKSGMTRVFTEDGVSVPVTVVEVFPNRVTQIKEQDTDGYRASPNIFQKMKSTPLFGL